MSKDQKEKFSYKLIEEIVSYNMLENQWVKNRLKMYPDDTGHVYKLTKKTMPVFVSSVRMILNRNNPVEIVAFDPSDMEGVENCF